MRNEIWKNGVLTDVIETPDEEIETPILETEITISPDAIAEIKTKLTDSDTNSIAKVKAALVEFFTELEATK